VSSNMHTESERETAANESTKKNGLKAKDSGVTFRRIAHLICVISSIL
jgi:hypothetical protein